MLYTTGSAGITACLYSMIVDGFQSQFAVNHLAHFLRTTSLLPQFEAGKPSRGVVLSSLANRQGDIQSTFNDFSNLQILCYVDYFPKAK
jgi:NAD(P)-dependent dehydrogenase (short-subunit alcohol dehydrogenase family)